VSPHASAILRAIWKGPEGLNWSTSDMRGKLELSYQAVEAARRELDEGELIEYAGKGRWRLTPDGESLCRGLLGPRPTQEPSP
jgi:Mn-dependent DtxR family transcriptional regulator